MMKQLYNLIIFIILLSRSFQWISNNNSNNKTIVNAVHNAQTHYLNKTLIEEMLIKSRNSTRDEYVKKTLAEAAGKNIYRYVNVKLLYNNYYKVFIKIKIKENQWD